MANKPSKTPETTAEKDKGDAEIKELIAMINEANYYALLSPEEKAEEEKRLQEQLEEIKRLEAEPKSEKELAAEKKALEKEPAASEEESK